MDSILINLLLKIHLYYPIGVRQIYTDYPGCKLFKDKIETKIKGIVNKAETPWSRFVVEVEKEFSKHKIFDYSYHQFPSYIASKQLEKSKNEEREITKELVISLSLLADYYTIFIKDSYKFLTYGSSTDDPQVVEVYYYKKCNVEKYHELSDSIKLLIHKNFPGYTFIEHSLLFNAEVEGGVIFGEDTNLMETNKYNVYEFLFSNNTVYKHRRVVLE